jgi:hypothetical protein
MAAKRLFRRSKLAQTIVAIVAIIATIVAVPFLVPVLAIKENLRRRRMSDVAGQTSCVTCGHLLGAAAMKLADEVTRSKSAEMCKKHPSARFLIFRTVFAICTNCGAEFTWDDVRVQFRLIRSAA